VQAARARDGIERLKLRDLEFASDSFTMSEE
jgi:hypothetical protein